MPAPISPDHPIRQLFQTLVRRTFEANLGLRESQVPEYVGNIMVDFIHRDNIYRIRSAQGKPLEEVAEMLVEGDVTLNATSFDREREVHKHIGDFTLFWLGVYPEMLRYFRTTARKDHLVDYVEQGKKSYRIAATFNHGHYADEAPVLRALAEEFELCMFGLNIVRREMHALGDPQFRAFQRMMGDLS